jgi:hypothetical protein
MKNNQKVVLQSLSMDLLRAALGRHRGSHAMADRFIEEASKRVTEIDDTFQTKLITDLKEVLRVRSDRQAEDLLMYSTLIRNRSIISG